MPALLLALNGCASKPPNTTMIHDWAADAVWYQIFPERFNNGDQGNDPTSALDTPKPILGWQIHPWESDFYRRQPWEIDVRADDFYWMHTYRRYGGDLQGIIDKLDYLVDLGINGIYLNPIFNADSHHKYDASTHTHIDYFFGPDPVGDKRLVEEANETGDPATWVWTEADKLFIRLLSEAHKRGIRIITDGVFNHVGRSHFAFQDVINNQQNSAYADWFEIISWDDPDTEENEFEYSGWWGVATLPELNEEDGTVVDGPRQYIFNAVKRWMDPNGDGDPSDGIDGWRLDVVDDMGTRWWKEWHTFVRSVNPSIFTIAEIWDTRPAMLSAELFTATMNYPFAMATIDFVANVKNKPSPSEYVQRLAKTRDAYGFNASLQLQNLIDSHDTDRLSSMIYNPDRQFDREARPDQSPSVYRINRPDSASYARLRLAVALQMTYVGAPMIYYGDELGMWGEDDPGVRKPMWWDDFTYEDEIGHPTGLERPTDKVAPDHALREYYKRAIALRNAEPALRHGTFEVLLTDDEKELLAFSRAVSADRLIIAVNNADVDRQMALEGMANWDLLFVTGSAEATEGNAYQLGPRSLAVFRAP